MAVKKSKRSDDGKAINPYREGVVDHFTTVRADQFMTVGSVGSGVRPRQ